MAESQPILRTPLFDPHCGLPFPLEDAQLKDHDSAPRSVFTMSQTNVRASYIDRGTHPLPLSELPPCIFSSIASPQVRRRSAARLGAPSLARGMAPEAFAEATVLPCLALILYRYGPIPQRPPPPLSLPSPSLRLPKLRTPCCGSPHLPLFLCSFLGSVSCGPPDPLASLPYCLFQLPLAAVPRCPRSARLLVLWLITPPTVKFHLYHGRPLLSLLVFLNFPRGCLSGFCLFPASDPTLIFL